MTAGRSWAAHLDPPGRTVVGTTGVRLTATGARVLAGEADRIALNGIGRWPGAGLSSRCPRR
jgi:hypothetical protein